MRTTLIKQGLDSDFPHRDPFSLASSTPASLPAWLSASSQGRRDAQPPAASPAQHKAAHCAQPFPVPTVQAASGRAIRQQAPLGHTASCCSVHSQLLSPSPSPSTAQGQLGIITFHCTLPLPTPAGEMAEPCRAAGWALAGDPAKGSVLLSIELVIVKHHLLPCLISALGFTMLALC